MSDGDAAGVGAGTEESGEVPTEGPGHGRGTGGARTNDACTAAVSRIDSLQTGQFVRSLSHESTHWTWNEWPHGSSRHCEASRGKQGYKRQQSVLSASCLQGALCPLRKTAVRFVSLLSARCPLASGSLLLGQGRHGAVTAQSRRKSAQLRCAHLAGGQEVLEAERASREVPEAVGVRARGRVHAPNASGRR